MFKFWNLIIEPIFRALDARRVIEIGVSDGKHTQHLIEYCASVNGHLDAIDPKPYYDFVSAQARYGAVVKLHQCLSLEVLPHLQNADVVVIDGDHNWYTVFNELKQLEMVATQTGSDFPLVLFHDVSWPYGRRDLYYAPETIPAEHLQPHAQKGIRLEVSRLLDTGGLNSQLFNALQEGGSHNGVLTAVEDFLDRSKIGALYTIPILYGLGILVSEKLQLNAALMTEINHWQSAEGLRKLLELLERERLNEVCKAQDDYARLEINCQLLAAQAKEFSNCLEIERAERNRLHSELQSILTSRSWRLTSILRAFTRRCKRLAAKIHRLVSRFQQSQTGRDANMS
jgi:hypothetical protein